jgi:hypothetical protein
LVLNGIGFAMDKLDDYSQRFADVLFQAFPEWKQFASVKKLNDADESGFLVVEVPAPTKGLMTNDLILKNGDYLWVYSDGEITVGFDYHHAHFDNFDFQTEAQNFADAIEFIKSILDEEVCFVAVFSGNSFCGSTSALANEKPDLSGWDWLDKSCQDVYVRSWRGTYNRKYSIGEVRGENKNAS